MKTIILAAVAAFSFTAAQPTFAGGSIQCATTGALIAENDPQFDAAIQRIKEILDRLGQPAEDGLIQFYKENVKPENESRWLRILADVLPDKFSEKG